MAVDPCLRQLMAQTIYVAHRTSGYANAAGAPNYGAPASARARVEPNRRVFQDERGEDVVSDFLILTETRIGLQDRLWLPGDGTTTERARQPKRVFAPPDVDGSVSHYEVYV